MIKKLRSKFIILSMIALFILLTLIVTGINALNYGQLTNETDEMLRVIAENGGKMPEFRFERNDNRPPFMSPETPYETRYFSVAFDSSGEPLFIDTKFISAIDPAKALELAEQVLNSGKLKGFYDEYRYLRISDKFITRICFLDCGRKLNAYYNFLETSVKMALIGYAGFFVVLLFFSKRIVAPVAESYEKQKRFVTDAGHEIKTPLAVIKADADVLEMENGENEWTSDIKNQTDRLTRLTENLVRLSRMEEQGNNLDTKVFSLSDAAEEAARSFSALAKSRGKDFKTDIAPGIEIRGNEKSITELIDILSENAVKYAPDGGKINLILKKEGRNVFLSVKNTVKEPISDENLKLMFERFYRLDESRNSETGGNGIGLSVAKAVAEAHGAKIKSRREADETLDITVSFPPS